MQRSSLRRRPAAAPFDSLPAGRLFKNLMEIKPGYKTTEHALACAVILLGIIVLLRSRDSLERITALAAPAIASAAYSQARGRAKAPDPFDLRRELTQLFRGRIAK